MAVSLMALIASLDLPRRGISAGFAPSISVTLLQVKEISIPAIGHRFALNLL